MRVKKWKSDKQAMPVSSRLIRFICTTHAPRWVGYRVNEVLPMIYFFESDRLSGEIKFGITELT